MAAGKKGRFVESSPEQIEALEQSLRPLTSEADAPPDTTGQPGQISTLTIWLFAAAAAFAGLLFADMPVAALGLGIPTAVIALGSLASDLSFPSARKRRRSEDAVRCYFKAVKHGRWKVAHACLSERARNELVNVPRIKKLGTVSRETKMVNAHGVASYWQHLVRSGGSHMRWVRKLGVEKLSGSEHVHRYRVALEVGAYRQIHLIWLFAGMIPGLLVIYLFCTSVWRTELEVFAFRHKSQWWLVSGAVRQLHEAAELPKARVVPR